MLHHTPLIATIVAGLCIAFVFGAIANRLKIPPLAGYLLAGIVVGPFTPGYVADQGLAPELAEIGVILLMFGVGLHFSLKDLLSVKNIAIPGALVQIGFATGLGWMLARLFGWTTGAGIVFGLSLSVASTVVLLRALQDQRILDSEKGKVAIGWLIVEDLVMVLALVLLPPFAGLLGGHAEGQPVTLSTATLLWTLGLTLAKVAAFVAVMLLVGRRVIPWVLVQIAMTGSKELFTLAVLAIALGVAFGSAAIFGVSFALGAFFAGMILGESELSHDAAADILPLRDAFSVLFFVSVGMLFNPHVLIDAPLAVLATFLIIVVGKSLAALVIVKLFRRTTDTALTIAASLAQIGEFSFILASLGISLKLLPEHGRDLILAGAILSIILNPLVFAIARRIAGYGAARSPAQGALAAGAIVDDGVAGVAQHVAAGHVIIVGYGRVGREVAKTLRAAQAAFVVVDDRLDIVGRLRDEGVTAVCGNGVMVDVLEQAGIASARYLVMSIPNAFEAAEVIRQARELGPQVHVLARAHSSAEIAHLEQHGAHRVVLGQREIARSMTHYIAGLDAEVAPGA
ncbi:Kef family K(+) transporter [Robbsia sp. Bb-Pol-6]|uniref:Kef family K(+) transporter n=1 Tax=Robbsia betulipollinis TaxID=2981849 RepID=A0ABT3ZNU0_9BURK|nr:YbaL family putative K(+) efflux transporter [Robbsia betulipollinis]MCY0388204.1 Kef family K(+) transporter [Robbsia betulipollinis]